MVTGYLFAALTGILFGLQGVYGRFLANKFPSVFLTWASFAFALPLVITILFFRGIPAIDGFNFAWATAVSFVLNLVAWNLFFRALAASPLALTMPFTAFTPLFLIPIAFVILGELPDWQGFWGILLIIAGAYTIHLQSGSLLQPWVNIFREKGTREMLVVALIWSVTAPVDKVAVLSSSPEFYGVTIYFLLAGAHLPYIYWRHGEHLKSLTVNLKNLILLGAVSGGVIIFQYAALQYIEVSYVIAFKRAGVMVSVLAGYFFFSEKNILKNFFATAMIIAGAILILL